MNILQFNASILYGAPRAARLGILSVFVLAGAALPVTSAQAAGGFSFTPNAGNYPVGSTLSVTTRVDTGNEETNAVTAEFTYPAEVLEYVSADASGSNFDIEAAVKGGNGIVHFSRGASDPVKGSLIIQKANFRVIGSGTAALRFTEETMAVSVTDNETNVATARSSASIGLTAATSPAPAPAPQPAKPSATTPPPRIVTKVTPILSNNTPAQHIGLANNDRIELTAPIDVQPATIQSDGISKVEYYLNGKLVKAVTVPPYKYRVDTGNLLNGTYQLKTKTYYTNGQTETFNQFLTVKNPINFTQIRLMAVKYVWAILLAILFIIGLIAVLLMRGRGGGNRSSGSSYYAPTSNGAPQV
jgi:hypothetical protein